MKRVLLVGRVAFAVEKDDQQDRPNRSSNKFGKLLINLMCQNFRNFIIQITDFINSEWGQSIMLVKTTEIRLRKLWKMLLDLNSKVILIMNRVSIVKTLLSIFQYQYVRIVGGWAVVVAHCQLCIEKTKIKKKEAGNGPFFLKKRILLGEGLQSKYCN